MEADAPFDASRRIVAERSLIARADSHTIKMGSEAWHGMRGRICNVEVK
ncbi:hypothetical protein GA0061100_104276 [Rhizobium hainanense]|uniref:Uncharacterized protein n=1 Tax=Rhizobium hainanense TaxID=52131 RepID=A0A1C3V412_9HYPH|nr:hypothetical protein GA0061100_104276 [Rhizobium hainanense]